MGLLNKYIFRKAAISIGGLIIFAICVLLMERLLRIFQDVSNSATPTQDATTMIVNLLPHYLGMAIPMALLLGTIITVDRLSRTSELTSALGSGVSLFQMTKPFILLAIILSGTALYVESIAIPKGRYQFRQAVHLVKQQSYAAILRQGTPTTVGNRTVFPGNNRDGDAIGPIFIYEEFLNNGERSVRITTAEEAQLVIREQTKDVVLQLENGKTRIVTRDKQVDGDFEFDNSAITAAASLVPFRARGDDERELTTWELFNNQDGSIMESVDRNTNNAALHVRLAKSVFLLLLPFIAVPFGLNYGRNPSSAGIFVGVVFLVAVQKALELGQSLGAAGTVPPWAGVWPIVFIVAALAFYLFQKSAYKMGQPPLTSFGYLVKDAMAWMKRDLKETKDTLSKGTVS